MRRLTHSNPAFKRYMQMSQGTRVFVFVEGFETDPYFYGQLCEQVFGTAGCTYEIVGGWRLAQTGGKTVLLDFHRYLATTNSLVHVFQGKFSLALFFLDKDIDDLLHSIVPSDYIVYTEYHSVENYLFVHGDIVKAAAAASSIEERELTAIIGDPEIWRPAQAVLWKDWVTFCVLVQKYGIPHQCSFRLAASTLNTPPDRAADPATVELYRQELEARSGMTPARFRKAYQAVARLVSSIYARKEHDRVFKGNWYLRLLEIAIERTAAGRPYNSHGISNRLQGAVASTVDFSAEWAEHFREPMRGLLARVV